MIKNVTINECTVVVELAQKLWPNHNHRQLQEEFSRLLTMDNSVVFVYYDEYNNEAKAFVQCEVRNDYVVGTSTSPVGYLKGIYVDEICRNQGIAKKLLKSCEVWAKNKGCTEFASDCQSDNSDSLNFHLKSGFKEASRTICFIKQI